VQLWAKALESHGVTPRTSVEVGTLLVGHTVGRKEYDNWPLAALDKQPEDKEATFTRRQAFARAFVSPPRVLAGVTSILAEGTVREPDTARAVHQNWRVEHVADCTGITFTFKASQYTELYQVALNWLALGERPAGRPHFTKTLDLDVTKDGWTSTDVMVTQTAVVEIRCSGSLRLGQGTGADGRDSNISPGGYLDLPVAGEDWLLPGAHGGAVVGRIDGKTFEIGELAQVRGSEYQGMLELAVNDGKVDGGHADNEGNVKVEVLVW
jgi:hypothetical protein